MIDSFNISLKEESLFVKRWRNSPTLKLLNLSLEDHRIHYTNEEGSFSYPLDINEDIYSIMKSLLESEGVLDFNK